MLGVMANILGSANAEVLYGTAEDDFVEGGAGDDTIVGGTGDDTLVGGEGADVFRFESASGRDVITDFDPSQDRLYLAEARSSLVEFLSDITEVNGDLVLRASSQHSITIKNLTFDEFDVSAFLPTNGLGSFSDVGFGALLRPDPSNGDQALDPIVLPLSNGDFAVTWQTFVNGDAFQRDIYSRIFNPDGEPVSDPFVINIDGGNNQNFVATPLEGGGFVVVWYSFEARQGYSAVYDNDGNAVSDATVYGTNSHVGVVALDDGGYLVLSSQTTVDGIRYNAQGEQVSQTFTIAEARQNGQEFGGIQLSNGTIVIVWDDYPEPGGSGGVGIRLYDNNLTPLTDAYLGNQIVDGRQWQTEVVELAGGGFVVVWETWGENQTESFQSFRIFDENGNPVTDEKLIDEPLLNFNSGLNTSVTATDDGGFAIIWKSTEGPIYFQQFDAFGFSVSDQLRIDEADFAFYGLNNIATLSDGTGVAAWDDGSRLIGFRLVDFAVRVEEPEGGSTLLGGDSDDYLRGGSTNDTLSGEGGADLIIGGAGLDLLSGGVGPDTLHGGPGADSLSGSSGTDQLFGGGGNDTLDGGGGNDTALFLDSATAVQITLNNGSAIRVGAEADTLISIEHLTGSMFADRLEGDDNFNRLVGADGADTLIGGAGNDTVEGGLGNDTVWAGAGDAGADYVVGGMGDDLLAGGAGDDLLVGGGATARGFSAVDIDAAEGRDTIFGGAGHDTVLGTHWSDINDNGSYDSSEEVLGSFNSNALYGGAGNDVVVGGGGADSIGGGTGDDFLKGRASADIIWGGRDNGNDTLLGNGGGDTLFGSGGDDLLEGSSGSDQLFGGAGADTVDGGSGIDSLYGGDGGDTLTGGSGVDTFFFAGSHGSDIVTDFDPGEDILFLVNTVTDFTDLASVQAAARQTAVNSQSGLLIDTGGGNSVFLVGVTSADLTEEALTL